MRTLIIACLFSAIAVPAPAQTPKTDNYDRQGIRFTSGRFELAGDLLLPRTPGPHPTVVYVWGSGTTSRRAHIENSSILTTFLDNGFAVFLYDKPGSDGSTGELDNGRLLHERAAILLDAIALLKQRKGVDPKAIGLYGSSQASYVMSIALAQTHEVGFMIAWSCPMENSMEQSAYLVRNYVLCAGGPAKQADAAEKAFLQRGRARTYAEYLPAAQLLDSIPAIRDDLGWAGVESKEEFSPADTASEAFFDPSAAVAHLTIPVLALYAQNDRQIDAKQGAAMYRRILAGANQPLSMVVVVPGADHNMVLSPRGCMQDQRGDYRALGTRTLSPVFLQTVAGWLARLKVALAGS